MALQIALYAVFSPSKYESAINMKKTAPMSVFALAVQTSKRKAAASPFKCAKSFGQRRHSLLLLFFKSSFKTFRQPEVLVAQDSFGRKVEGIPLVRWKNPPSFSHERWKDPPRTVEGFPPLNMGKGGRNPPRIGGKGGRIPLPVPGYCH